MTRSDRLEPDPLLLETLRTLRQTLHALPESAGHESGTAATVAGFLSGYAPDRLLCGLGGHGVAALFEGEGPGPTVMVRCELDALPVEREEAIDPTRGFDAEHRCGHDGHMAIVCGLAPLLSRVRPERGRVVLLFQPAEETGEGAQRVVDDPAFTAIQPDCVLGLHNLPGYARDAVVVRKGVFSSASVGLHVHLQGLGSHAAEPDLGHSPADALSELLTTLPRLEPVGREGRIATVTHAHLGRPSFGLTPGHAEIWTTLRAGSSEGLGLLRAAAERCVVETAARHDLIPTLGWREAFPETRNDPDLVELLGAEARSIGLPLIEPPDPFSWSEDFGVYGHRWPALFFGLGIGEQSTPLHQTGYAFPEPSVATGVRIFARLIDRLTGPPTGIGDSLPTH